VKMFMVAYRQHKALEVRRSGEPLGPGADLPANDRPNAPAQSPREGRLGLSEESVRVFETEKKKRKNDRRMLTVAPKGPKSAQLA
jgi:hypothetical protein